MIRIITIMMLLLWSPAPKQDSLSIFLSHSEEDYTQQITSFNDLAFFYLKRGMLEDACSAFSKAESMINISTQEIPVSNLYKTYTGYAQALTTSLKFDKVEKLLDKALELEISGKEKGNVYGLCSYYYLKKGNLKKADFYYNKYTSLSGIGRPAYLLKMRIENAKKNYSDALHYGELLYKENNHNHLVLKEIASIYENMGEYEEANKYLEKSIDILDSLMISQMLFDMESFSERANTEEFQLQKEEQELILKNRMIWIVSLISATLLVLITAIIILLTTKVSLSKKLITSQKNLNKALVKIQEESRIKTKFLKNLSRDIRIPLQEILTLSDELSQLVKEEIDYKRYSKVIHESSDQLVKLINDSIDISDFELSKQYEFSYIHSIIQDAIKYLELPLRPGVTINYDVPTDYQEVYIQRRKVVKILSNLLHNAAKFTLKGSITIKGTIDADFLTFSVSDTGCGIPLNQQDYVFEYFSKIDSMCQGLGLGLPLSRLLAESMDGKLYIDKDYTKGCRAVLVFPFDTKPNK